MSDPTGRQEADSTSSPEADLARVGRRQSRPVAILIGAGFLAVAIALSVAQPTEDTLLAPYVGTIGALDSPTDARTFTLTVTSVGLADRVQLDDWTGSTPGVWLVVDAQYVQRIARGSIAAEFMIGDVSYLSTSRIGYDGLNAGSELPGLGVAGSIVFELPESALTAPGSDHAVVRFSASGDPVLDSALDLTLDLGALERQSTRVLLESGRVAG